MDESVSFGTLGATGHGVTEHLSVPVCGSCACCNVQILSVDSLHVCVDKYITK